MKVLEKKHFDAVKLCLAGASSTGPSVVLILPKAIAESRSHLYNLVFDNIYNVEQLLSELEAQPKGKLYYIQTPLFNFGNNVDLSKAILDSKMNTPITNDMKMLLERGTKTPTRFKFFKNSVPVGSVYINMVTRTGIKFTEYGISTSSKTMMVQMDGCGGSKPTYPVIKFDRPFLGMTFDNRQPIADGKLFDMFMVFMNSSN